MAREECSKTWQGKAFAQPPCGLPPQGLHSLR
jgi:hypothetical protein